VTTLRPEKESAGNTWATRILGRAAWILVAADAGFAFYKEGKKILNYQAGN
jgi:hypothetical protein